VRALADARAGRLGGVGERAVPERRLKRTVVLGQAAHETGPPERGCELVALHQLAREPVLTQGGGVVAHVLRLLVGDGQAQQPHAPDRVVHAELGRELVHVRLRRQRARVHRARSPRPVALAGVVVERGRPGDQEPAVAAARAACDGPGLEHQRLDAALREPARTREPRDTGADHAHLHLGVAVERGTCLVGRVQPVGRGARDHEGARRESCFRISSLKG
jgi:hypothetical protein